MAPHENLRNIHVDLPNHPTACGESMWAVDLGDDLYELRNVPFLAYGLNYGDVVRATQDGPGLKPEIRSVEILGADGTLLAQWNAAD